MDLSQEKHVLGPEVVAASFLARNQDRCTQPVDDRSVLLITKIEEKDALHTFGDRYRQVRTRQLEPPSHGGPDADRLHRKSHREETAACRSGCNGWPRWMRLLALRRFP